MNPIRDESEMMKWAYGEILKIVPTKGRKAERFAFEVASAFIGQGHQFAKRFEKLNYHGSIERALLKTAEDYADQTKSKLEQLRATTLVKVTDKQLEKIKNLFPLLAKGGIKEARHRFLWSGKEELAGISTPVLQTDSQNLDISSFHHYLAIINKIKKVANNYFTLSERAGNNEAKINTVSLDFKNESEKACTTGQYNQARFSEIVLKEKVKFRRALVKGEEFAEFKKNVAKELKYIQTVTTGSRLLEIITKFKRLKNRFIQENTIFNFSQFKTLYKDFSDPIKAAIITTEVQKKLNVRNMAYDELEIFTSSEIQKIKDQFARGFESIIDNLYKDQTQNIEIKSEAITYYKQEDLRLRKEMVESSQFQRYCTEFEEEIKSREEKTLSLKKRLIQCFEELKEKFKDSLEICSVNHLLYLFDKEQKKIIDAYNERHSEFFRSLQGIIHQFMLKSEASVNASTKEKNKIIEDFVKHKNQLIKSRKLTQEESEEYDYEWLVMKAIVATKVILKI